MLRLFSAMLFYIGLAIVSMAHTAEWQSIAAIQTAVETFLKERLATEPGQRSISVSRIDPRLKLARCDRLEPYLPSGSRLWGNSSVGVRCLSPTTWSLYVPVHIKVVQDVLVAVRPIASGQSIQAEDVQLQTRDVTAYAGSVLVTPEQALGRNVTGPIASGTVLRAEMLRAPTIILQGQNVTLVAQGAGFKVTSEGQAMGNASVGQVVSVKTRSGQIIKGIARSPGVVEVYF